LKHETDSQVALVRVAASHTYPTNRSEIAEGNTVMAEQNTTQDALLTPAEVAALFRVNPKTVTRWARAGKITAIRTLGGHRRFRASEIKRCLEQMEREGA
jgi:excisionase family DNA binding protein